jgi:ribosomal protein S18 acetylase RimI-like enzyme
MHIRIRQATKSHAALIADLSRQTFYETFAAQNRREDMELFLREQFTHDTLMAEVGATGNTFLIAYAANEPVGYARLRATGTNTTDIEIARLYATAAVIGRGVGKALMQACLDVAKEENKKTVWLGVWEKNARAITFYTAWGFEKVGEQDFRLGNDVQRDWIMQKTL